MANVFPFRPYRYSAKAGDLNTLVTQPYDKISPGLQKDYLAANPYNAVRLILGERFPEDSEADNVYTRARDYLSAWVRQGILVQDAEPGFYAYFQEFEAPGAGERVVRKGFTGLCELSPYSAGIVHRHEKTLTGPKKDRTELLEHTAAHFGQIFVLYADQERAIDQILDKAAAGAPIAEVVDLYGVVHRLWPIQDPSVIEEIRNGMAPRKLIIADGHHRYETALAYSERHPEIAGSNRVMMTFVNMNSPGLKILATHRVLKGGAALHEGEFRAKAARLYQVRELSSVEDLEATWAEPHESLVRIGVVLNQGRTVLLLERNRQPGELDVAVLHRELLEDLLGIGEEAVREGALQYVRGAAAAVDLVKSGQGSAAFLLEPTGIEEMARVSFAGGVMPQKSTDFYPKLLSGLTIYKMGE